MTIRRYGSGKFNTVLDSYVYATSLDGGADEELGEADTFGWYGVLTGGDDLLSAVEREARDHDDELTEEEAELLRESAGVILSEDSQGFAYVDYFDHKRDLVKAWRRLEEEYEASLEEDGDEDEAW